MPLPLRISPGGSYQVGIKPPRGRTYWKTLPTKNREEAMSIVRQANLEQVQRAAVADALVQEVWTRLLAGRRITCAEACERYAAHQTLQGSPSSTIDEATRIIHLFLHAFGLRDQTLAAIEEKHVADFVNEPGRAKLSTREATLSVIRAWLDYCAHSEQGWVVNNVTANVRVRLEGLTQEQLVSNPIKPFENDEVQKLLAAIPPSNFWHGAVLFAYNYGLRLSTVAMLEETNIVGNQLRVYATKGRRIVNERLVDELIAWLELWKQHRPHSELPYLFPEHAALAADGRNDTLSNQFTRLCRKSGITNRSFHGLRKTAARNQWNEELSALGDEKTRALAGMVAAHGLKRVQEVLGHAPGSDVTRKHYL